MRLTAPRWHSKETSVVVIRDVHPNSDLIRRANTIARVGRSSSYAVEVAVSPLGICVIVIAAIWQIPLHERKAGRASVQQRVETYISCLYPDWQVDR